MPASASSATNTVPQAPPRLVPRLTADEQAVLAKYRQAREAVGVMREEGHGMTALLRVSFGADGSVDVHAAVQQGKGW